METKLARVEERNGRFFVLGPKNGDEEEFYDYCEASDFAKTFNSWAASLVAEAVQDELGWILRRIADASSRDRMFEMIVERRKELRGESVDRARSEGGKP